VHRSRSMQPPGSWSLSAPTLLSGDSPHGSRQHQQHPRSEQQLRQVALSSHYAEGCRTNDGSRIATGDSNFNPQDFGRKRAVRSRRTSREICEDRHFAARASRIMLRVVHPPALTRNCADHGWPSVRIWLLTSSAWLTSLPANRGQCRRTSPSCPEETLADVTDVSAPPRPLGNRRTLRRAPHVHDVGRGRRLPVA
jgi:hypothetical protein